MIIGTKLIIPIGSIVPTNISYTSQILEMNIGSFTTVFPFLDIGTLGTSILGTNLYYIKFGNGPKEVFYNASTHANEWITTPLLMKFIEILSKAYVMFMVIMQENYLIKSLYILFQWLIQMV